MDRAYWCSLSDKNLAESHREFSRWHPDGEILERDGVLLTRGASRYPGVNFAMCTGPDVDAAQLVARAKAFFRPRADGFAIRARAHADAALAAYCRTHELFMAGENVGLMRQAPIDAAPEDGDIHAQVACSRAEVETFAEVATAAFSTIGLPEATALHIFQRPEAMLEPHIIPVLGYLGVRPAATALALLSHGVAGLYWVGTAPWARGRGLARAVTTAAHNAALSQGARAVVLQASGAHAPLYERLGYRALTRYPWYFAGQIPGAA